MPLDQHSSAANQLAWRHFAGSRLKPDRLQSLGDMQLARPAVIEKPVGNIAVLLRLQQH